MGHIFNARISFYDTDAMGVMHHSGHIKKFEDARVDWLRFRGLDRYHFPAFDLVLAVTNISCHYIKPVFFEEQISVQLQVKKQGLKILIRYAMYNKQSDLLATGHTEHVPLNKELKLIRYPKELINELEKEEWTETWPLNL